MVNNQSRFNGQQEEKLNELDNRFMNIKMIYTRSTQVRKEYQ